MFGWTEKEPAAPPTTITIDREACQDCGRCRAVCPLTRFLGASSIDDALARSSCIRCGACMAICSKGAVTVGGLAEPTELGEIPDRSRAMNLVKARRSVRTFKADKISKEDWAALIEAVQYSPTGHNNQSVDMVIIESPRLLSEISQIGMKVMEKMYARLNHPIHYILWRRMMGDHAAATFKRASAFVERQHRMMAQGEDPILFNAPALVLFTAPKGDMMGPAEAVIAAQNVMLLAPALGLATCYAGVVMAAFSGMYSGIKKVVGIPHGTVVLSALLVGHPRHRYHRAPPRKARQVTFL